MADNGEVPKEVEQVEKDPEPSQEEKEPETKDEVEPKEEVEAKAETEEEAPKVAENGGNEEEPAQEATEDATIKAEPDQEKETESAKDTEDGHSKAVAKHYNEHPENTREERKGSRIFYLRNFNNWVKSVLINETIEKLREKLSGDLSVLDMCCGKGGDLLKWQKGKVGNLVCADIAEVSMRQCEQRFKDMQRNRHSRKYLEPLFDIQFITADCSKETLSEQYDERNKKAMFDMTSCQFAFHYSFESQEQAEKMLQNACEKLKPGGYFIGTMPCAYELVRRLKESDDLSFGNDVYTVTFTEKENFSLFGHKYDFHLDSVVDCPEFLVNFPLLEKMAERYDMKLEVAKGFQDYYLEHLEKYKVLLYRMQGLETYPPRREHDKLSTTKDDAYTEAKDFLDGVKAADKEDSSPKYRDHRNKSGNFVGTLSKDEWEAAGIYMVFAFKKKGEPEVKEEKMEEEEWVTQDEALGDDDKVDENAEEMEQSEVQEKAEDVQVKPKDDAKEKEDEGVKEEGIKEEKTEEGAKEEAKEEKTEEVDGKEEKTEEVDGKEEKTEEVDVKKEQGEEEETGGDGETKEEEKTEEETEVKTEEEPRKTATPTRGGRGRRSAGSASEETKEEEDKPKRETRKRKSTGGSSASGEEEPPEKKKA